MSFNYQNYYDEGCCGGSCGGSGGDSGGGTGGSTGGGSCGGDYPPSGGTVYVTSVSVSPWSIYLNVGEWYYYATATVEPCNADNTNVYWYSDNSCVASVNSSTGYIYANGAGTTRIYAEASDGSGCRDYLTVTVSDRIEVSSVSLGYSCLSLTEGDSFCIPVTVTPYNADNRSLRWSSSNECVATVIGGVVTAHAAGSTYITATATDGSGKSDSCLVTVSAHRSIPVSSVSVSPGAKTMTVGASAYFYATVCPGNATNGRVVWSSDSPCVATVNPHSGLVYAKSAGRTRIVATAMDGSGRRGYCCLTVTQAARVESVTLTPACLVMSRGDTYRPLARVCPDDAANKTLLWSSSDPTVAEVNRWTGRITAHSAGSATVTATAQDGGGAQASCTVTVTQTTQEPREEENKNTVKESTVADPVDAYTGAHQISNTLMSLYGGQNLRLVAHYDSTQLAVGTLGAGWYHNYEKYLRVDGCEARVYNSPSSFSRYVADSDCGVRFTCCSAAKNGYVLTVDHSRAYPYIIDCNSEKTEYYNAAGDLAKVTDHHGFEVLISYAGTLVTITDGTTGKKITLEKDASCRIIRVYDDAARQTLLTYTGDLLTAICDVNGNTLTYTYDTAGRIKSGTDGEGVRYFENTYDDYGRVIRQKDGIPGSAPTVFSYEGNVRVTTDRNGKTSRREYNSDGLLVKHTDENGNTKTYAYDSRCNVIRETDAAGNSVEKVYGSFNKPTQITDQNGSITRFTYDAAGNVTKICHPAVDGVIPEETFAYNERNQVIRHTDLRGTLTLYTYDACGMPATQKTGNRPAVTFTYQDGLLKARTDAAGNTTTYIHNAIGQVIARTDAAGKTATYAYDAAGNLLRATDENGKSVLATYDANGQKTSLTDQNGNKTEYSYNGNMKNTAVTFPDGNTETYAYDGEDRPVKITDRAGNITRIAYDNAGRVTSRTFADGATVTYEYDAVGNLVRQTNPAGGVTTKTYDAAGNVLTVTDHEGNITRYQYNAQSKPIRVTNAVAGTTLYRYAPSGDLLCETDALGHSTAYTYDAFGNRLTATDAENHTTTYTYDACDRLLTTRDALGHITCYTYDALGRLTAVKDALNRTTAYTYDALGRRTTVTDARGNTFTTAYDAAGNVIKTTDARGTPVSVTTYNNLNLPLTVTDAMGKTTAYTYNALGKTESITDALNRRTVFTYNARGQNTAVRDAANGTSSATYDPLGNVTRLAGPLGGAADYTYDAMGRLTTESTASGGTLHYTYHALNVREKLTNARGQERRLFYDAMGRVTGCVSPEDSVAYTYDIAGNVLTVTDENGTIRRTYDALGHILSCTDTYGATVSYEYDAAGQLTKLVYPDQTAVTYEYDAVGNLTRVTDWAGRITTYTYDVNNRVIGVRKPDGSTTATTYDALQRVTSTAEKTAGGTTVSGFEYTYDNLSNIVEEKVLDKNVKLCYTYDSLNRVTSRTARNLCDNSVISTENYTYDAAGNLTDAPDSCFAYDTNNRLIAFEGRAVSYDPDGNMLSNGSLSCTYDSANRLITAGGHTYTYNAENVRIRNLCADADTTYTYDTNCKLSRLLTKTTNGVTTKYVYGLGLIGEEKEGNFKTYHFDNRGSTVAITDECGTVTDTFAYDTYGKLISHNGTSFVIFAYNGRDGVVTDKNGLIYMRARYYSPDMRRFVNADVIPGTLSNAITLNRYAYANGNPVSNVDPFGFWSFAGTWDNIKSWGKQNIVDPIGSAYNNAKKTIISTYNHTKNAISKTSEEAQKVTRKAVDDVTNWATDCYHTIKTTAVKSYNDAKRAVNKAYEETVSWVADTAEVIADKASRTADDVRRIAKSAATKAKDFIDVGIDTASTFFGVVADLGKIVLDNTEISVGICFGIGMSGEDGIVGFDAATRSDIIGIQLKDGNVRVGHPGKFGFSVGIGPFSVGPQNNVYEDFDFKYREVEETSYWDIGWSRGKTAAFAIGYHCDASISYSGIVMDVINYFKSLSN